ncbi:UNVERIFIED_CONTAM: hypothetical protein FKN15_004697 [Acipenser sinensis]
MMLHGGQHHMYYSRSKTTHIIATNLPNSKIKELKGEKVVRPEWITDSIQAGRLLSYVQYQLYAKQKGLNFNNVCKNEEPRPGPSNIHKEFENRVNGTAKSMPDPVRNSKVNGLHGWENLEEEDEDFEFRELEPVSPVRNQKAMDRYRDPPTMANGHAHRSNCALKPLEQTLHSGKSSVDNTQCPLLDRDSIDFRDCGAQWQQHANQNSDAQSNSADAANLSSLHSIIKLNGAHHLTVQGPLHAKNTAEPSPSKLSTAGLASPHAVARPGEPNFISEFYSRSRLHHISTWKCEFTDFVNTLQRQSNGLFLGREKIKKERTSLPSTDTENTGPPTPAGPQRRQTCIMHVDMDCFFVSVGIRERPDLQGKPVAVTSNRGGGKAALRPGANPELEMQYYKRRCMKNKTEEKVPDKVDFCTWENPDAAHMNGVDLDRTALSMAEIASCSYEASYTHDIEAVSCDEALVDVTDIMTELGVSADCIASALRAEIKDKTKCCASIGMGSNILLARMATRKAKPDGQYYLKPEEVDDFIRDQLVTSLPEAEAFLLNLSEEIQRRLVAAGVKGKRLTLKVMVRKAGAPVEPAKYGGHGICDNLARTVNLEQATDNSKIIGRETLKLFQMMKLNVSDVRGVGMQMQQLVPVLRTASVASSHTMAQSRSVKDLLLAQKSKRPGSLATAAPKGQCLRYSFALILIDQVGRYHIPAVSSCVVVHESAECCDRSSTVRNAAVLSPQKTLSTLEPMPSTSRSEPVVRYNGGLHTPHSIKTRLNLSIEIPSPSQIDHSVLEALPAEIREQVEQMCLSRSEETPNGFVTGPESLGPLILQVPEQLSQNSHSGIIVALPELSQVDPDVFSALPAELQEELKTAYNQRQRAPEVPINQQITVVTRNTHLPLKQPLTVKTKKHNKKNLVSPVKRTESPLKNKLLKSPAKSSGIRTGSPQKLIADFLKYEESATEKLKLETGPSTSGHVPVSQEEASKVPVHQGPNLAGAFELGDIKALLKEWVTSISDPMEEDILQVVRYCTDLIEDKDLEKLDLVIKYMKRLMQQSVDSVWNMAFDFILDNIQVVIQQTYGSTLKIA